MSSREEIPCLFCNPNGTYQQVNRSLKKCRMVALHLVAQKQQHPAADKQRAAPDPFREDEQYDPRKNQRDSDSVQQLVPAGSVLAIILRHVVRQSGHSAPPCGTILRSRLLRYLSAALVRTFGTVGRVF